MALNNLWRGASFELYRDSASFCAECWSARALLQFCCSVTELMSNHEDAAVSYFEEDDRGGDNQAEDSVDAVWRLA